MIETLKESSGTAFGFKIVGDLTTNDVTTLTTQIDALIAAHTGKPLGVLADLTAMSGATWSARWAEMHFLRRHANYIARLAIVCDNDWQEVAEMAVNTAGGMQAETLYYHSSEIDQAWHWIRMNPRDQTMPVRLMYAGTGLFADYTPEYVGI